MLIHHIYKVLFRQNRSFVREVIEVSYYGIPGNLNLEKIGPIALDLISNITIKTFPERLAISGRDLLVQISFCGEEKW
ncbi:MAG: hypothetical protein ABR991_06310 [Terracidiphilus sp.]